MVWSVGDNEGLTGLSNYLAQVQVW